MSWSQWGRGIEVVDAEYTAETHEGADITSLSPLLLGDSTAGYYIRLYGIDYKELCKSAGGANFDINPSAPTNTADWTKRYKSYSGIDYIVYADSPTFESRSFTNTVTLDKHSTTHLIFNTCIPRVFSGVSLNYQCITDATTGHYSTTTSAQLKVTYRDPQVIALPGQYGYLMVIARYVQLSSDGNTAQQDNSRSQIVAWWSDTAAFTGDNVVGPFLLVDDSMCWHEEQTFRMWVGVPGVALVDIPEYAENSEEDGWQLFIYYVIEETALAYRGVGDCSDLHDAIYSSAYDIAKAALEGMWGAFSPGVACKRIKFTELWDKVKDEQSAGSPTAVTDEAVWDPSSAVDGDLIGTVNFYFSDGSESTDGRYPFGLLATPFFDLYPSYKLRVAAPHPLGCGLARDRQSLYVAMTMVSPGPPASAGSSPKSTERDPRASSGPERNPRAATSSLRGTGHGIWRGRAGPHGRWIYDEESYRADGSVVILSKVWMGRDFVFAPLDADNLSPDQVAESDYPTLWIDPGFVQLDDRSFWGLAGIRDLSTTDGNGELTAFIGTRMDGCETWSSDVPLTFPEHVGAWAMGFEPPPLK